MRMLKILKIVRNIYSSIKIIVCLNNKIKFQNKDRNTLFIYSDSDQFEKKKYCSRQPKQNI